MTYLRVITDDHQFSSHKPNCVESVGDRKHVRKRKSFFGQRNLLFSTVGVCECWSSRQAGLLSPPKTRERERENQCAIFLSPAGIISTHRPFIQVVSFIGFSFQILFSLNFLTKGLSATPRSVLFYVRCIISSFLSVER